MGSNNSVLSTAKKLVKRKASAPTETPQTDSPVRKKFCPENVIYEECFLNGVGHDVVVKILGKEWKLHKESLMRSPYFASMFSGSWKESSKKVIDIQIPDPSITEKSIKVVLGSLYQNNIPVNEEDVFGVVACATLFQWDQLLGHCEDIILSSISFENVLLYHDIGEQYNLCKVLNGSLTFLLVNLISFYPVRPIALSFIDCAIMKFLISSPELVTTSPIDVYRLLRFWLYLKLNSNFKGDEAFHEDPNIRAFFTQKPKTCSYLETPEGLKYLPVFKALEMYPLLSSTKNIIEIQEDNIIPKAWLLDVIQVFLPIVYDMMHNKQPPDTPIFKILRRAFILSVKEKNLAKNSVKWSTILSTSEMCCSRNRNTWLTFTLCSYGLSSEWKFTGSSLKVMFTPDNLVENSILYLPLFCRLTIYALNSKNQILKYVSKGASRLIQKSKPEEIFSLDRKEYYSANADSYIVSLKVFVAHRLILTKLLTQLHRNKDEILQVLTLQPVVIEELGENNNPNNNDDNNNDDDASSTSSVVEVDDDDIGSDDEEDLDVDAESSGEEADTDNEENEEEEEQQERNEVLPDIQIPPRQEGNTTECQHDFTRFIEDYDEYDDKRFVQLYIPSKLHCSLR